MIPFLFSIFLLGDTLSDGDNWVTEISEFSNPKDTHIIQDKEQNVNIYLRNINMLWDLC